MKGYPKVIATKQDFLNLLNLPEFRGQALKDLKELYNLSLKTAVVKRSIRPADKSKMDGEWIEEALENPNPIWKQKGFKSLQEVEMLLKNTDVKLEVTNG